MQKYVSLVKLIVQYQQKTLYPLGQNTTFSWDKTPHLFCCSLSWDDMFYTISSLNALRFFHKGIMNHPMYACLRTTLLTCGIQYFLESDNDASFIRQEYNEFYR